MVRPKHLVEAVLYTLKNSGNFPDDASYVGYQPDIDSESIKLPLVEVSMGAMIEVNESNTDKIGVKKDDNGRTIGDIYETLYVQTLDIAVWTAQGSKYSPRDLSNTVRDVLYEYTTVGPNKTIRHPDGPLDEVWRFDMLEGTHTNDLGTSPTLRRWEQTVEISASEQYITEPDSGPVEAVDLSGNNEDQSRIK